MTDSEQSSFTDHPFYREFVRIFGEQPDAGDGFMLLPLIGEDDALAFLRTVPAGTLMSDLPGLAAAYRAGHPVRLRSEDSENDDRAV